jgi:serine/threonine protein kinase
MDTYQYKYGDRPLEGYTIQRAAGRGGFGEVYYAISDSGRQVALKAVQSYEQIELRGISQCMNLKSPHLVTIFDVKYNDQGRPFVIMEYVSGPALSDLLKESPGGLGPQKAAFFLREIGKGLSYLHECGIVHRDLKPSNIFYENGYVKIGDYGLTKAVDASRNGTHNTIVGTIQYMAPETTTGHYDRRVDIYALGVVLYEMLTGQLPFSVSDLHEILVQHKSLAPSMDTIKEPFAHVIQRAMAKDPDERYQAVQAMIEDVFDVEYIRNDVSQFSPEELTILAERVAVKMRNARPPGLRQQSARRERRDRQAHIATTSNGDVTSHKQVHPKSRTREGRVEAKEEPSRAKVLEWEVWVQEWCGEYGTIEHYLRTGIPLAMAIALFSPIATRLGCFLLVSIVATSFAFLEYRWRTVRRNRYRRACAEKCLAGGDYIRGASFALTMGRLGVDQAAGGAIVVALGHTAMQNNDLDLAKLLYETGSRRWRAPHAKLALQRLQNTDNKRMIAGEHVQGGT